MRSACSPASSLRSPAPTKKVRVNVRVCVYGGSVIIPPRSLEHWLRLTVCVYVRACVLSHLVAGARLALFHVHIRYSHFSLHASGATERRPARVPWHFHRDPQRPEGRSHRHVCGAITCTLAQPHSRRWLGNVRSLLFCFLH